MSRSGAVSRGFGWSALNSATLRLGSLVTGMVLARILAPEDFGVYAIALMVQAILINLAELGLAADLVRHGNFAVRGPTITTIALIASSGLMLLMMLAADPVAGAMGEPEAGRIIQVMALTLPLAGLTVVPFARLQRDFQQGKLFAIDLVNFTITTSLTVVLAVAGWGALSLAIGRVVGQVASTLLQFAVTGERLRVGFRRDVASSGVRFGLPLALAGLLSWSLLNVDTVVIGSVAGATALGYYVLAFNVSSWPSSVIGTAIRAVAFPAFARRQEAAGGRDPDGLVAATSLAWAAAVPVAAGLVLFADPVIRVLYGDRWAAAAEVLSALAMFGALRVVFDVWVAYLTASGASGSLLITQGVWILVLAPVMYAAVTAGGIAGAGWAHVLVASVCMLPVHLFWLARLGVGPGRLLGALVPGSLGVIPAALASWWAADQFESTVARLVVGAAVLALVDAALMARWFARRRVELAAATPRSYDSTTVAAS